MRNLSDLECKLASGGRQVLTQEGIAFLGGIGIVGGGYLGAVGYLDTVWYFSRSPAGVIIGAAMGSMLPVAFHYVANGLLNIYEMAGLPTT